MKSLTDSIIKSLNEAYIKLTDEEIEELESVLQEKGFETSVKDFSVYVYKGKPNIKNLACAIRSKSYIDWGDGKFKKTLEPVVLDILNK